MTDTVSSIQLSINQTVVGGIPDSIMWLEKGFKMDIDASSFPNNTTVNISVSLAQFNPFKLNNTYKIITEIYNISATERLINPVTLHLLVTGQNVTNKLYILHQHHDTMEMIPIDDPLNTSFLSFKLSNFSVVTIAADSSAVFVDVTCLYTQYSWEVIVRLHKKKVKMNKYCDIFKLIDESYC